MAEEEARGGSRASARTESVDPAAMSLALGAATQFAVAATLFLAPSEKSELARMEAGHG
jgi:hypothetical protein